MDQQPDSIAEAVARLRLWLSRDRPGMARIEYSSAYSRAAVLDQLRDEIRVEEIALRRGGAEEVVGQMLEALGSPERRLVSFTGLELALPDSQKEAIQVVNFQREAFAAAKVPQVWWLPSHFVGLFLRVAPDLDSWFDLKLRVTELRQGPVGSEWLEPRLGKEPEEARRQAGSLFARAEQAARSGDPWLAVWRELVSPGLASLREADLHLEADAEAARLGKLMEGLQGQLAQPATAEAFDALARVYEEQCNWDAARRAQERALAMSNSEEESASYRSNLANILLSFGEYQAAREQIELALASDLHQFGPDHPNVAVRRSNLAVILGDLGEHQAAREQIELALASDLRQFGPDHPNVAVHRSNLANILGEFGEHEAAREQIELSLASDLRQFGPDHPTVAVSRSNLANILRDLGEPQAAREQIEIALASDLRQFGPDHPNVAIRRGVLAQVLYALKEYPAAWREMELALAGLRAKLPAGHPHIGVAEGDLAGIRRAMGE